MNPFTWNDMYSLGEPQTDSDHQALFRMAEQLYDALKNGAARDQLDGYLARLASYARFHFEDEEALMRRIGYPDLARHRLEHEEFRTRLSLLQKVFQSGDGDLDEAMLDFLRNWLERHVCGSDQRLAQYSKNRVREPASNRANENVRAPSRVRGHKVAVREHATPATK